MAAGLLATSMGTAVAANGNGQDNRAEKVTICHATGTPDDAGNGYVEITPAEPGAVRGHSAWDFKKHEPSKNGHEADIVPPFTYTDTDGDHEFPGQNWDAEGQAIHENGCEPLAEEPPVEEPPVEEPPAEEPPVEEPPVEEPPVEEPPVEEPPAEEPPAGEAPVEEPQTPAVVQTDGFTTDSSLLTALGLAALLGGGAAVVTVGVRTAARRD